MKLSAPVYRLKRRAKALAREENSPLHIALDRVAREEGFRSWSLLAARLSAHAPSQRIYRDLSPGDLVLVGARPGHGKTLMGIELIVEAVKAGGEGVFFTLEYSAADVLAAVRATGADPAELDGRFAFDVADGICAGHIIERLATAPHGTIAVVDYLQLLDQKRENPDLATQVHALKDFAAARGLIVVLISQIDRKYDPAVRPCPGLDDVRLPNPLDLSLFTKTCFLNDGLVEFNSGAAA